MSNCQPKVGILSFGPLYRESSKSTSDLGAGQQRICKRLEAMGMQPVVAGQGAYTSEELYAQADELLSRKVDCVLLHLPAWTSTVKVAQVYRHMNLPVILCFDRDEKTPYACGTMMASAGVLVQLGIPHLRIFGEIDREDNKSRIVSYARAAKARNQLRHQTFGLFGGLTYGMYIGVIDPVQWVDIFGVEVEQIDEWEVYKRSRQIAAGRVEKFLAWLGDHCLEICDVDKPETVRSLKLHIAIYLATKDTIAENRFDFVGWKCTGLRDILSSEAKITSAGAQCISAAFLACPGDGEGPKEPIAYGCEADCDGALSMHVLKLVSGGKPTYFADVCEYYGNRIIGLRNCGSMTVWFAARSDKMEENLKRVRIRNSVLEFVAFPGDATMARLYRENYRYKMAIVHGEFVEAPKESTAKQNHTGYFKSDIDAGVLMDRIGSHHVHVAPGNCVGELTCLCEMLKIEPVLFR